MAVSSLNGVNSINLVSPVSNGISKVQDTKVENTSFADFLKDAVNKVSDAQIEAQQAADDFAAGKNDNIHQVMILSEKADMALQFTMQIRNKIMDAYSEIMRMQI